MENEGKTWDQVSLVKKESKWFESYFLAWFRKANSQVFPPGKYGYEFVTEHTKVIKISRLDRRLCELLKMVNENDVAKRAIISQPEDSQKVLPGRSMANSKTTN